MSAEHPFAYLVPASGLALWTLLVLLLIPFHRLEAGFQGRLAPDDFKFGESDRVTSAVRIPNRNYMNLLEAPVLFYLACVCAHLAACSSQWMLYLAWAYVGLRVLHSVVHLSYNNVVHRLTVFAVSNGVLVIMWMLLLIHMLRDSNLHG